MYQRTGCDREDKSGPGIASPGKNSDGRHDGAYGCGRHQVAPTVGAERSGRTAVSHRQEKLVDLHLARLLRIFLRRKQAGQQSFPVLLPQTFYNNSTLIKLLDIEMTRRQSTDKDVSLKGFQNFRK